MVNQLTQITDFIRSIEVLKTTVRHNWFHNGRQESVAEHSWRMALFFITVQESLHLEVDVLKIIKMILVHDIPE
jgi:putative hydrolases of HD superfamily